jgi:basic membrane protein A
MEGLSMKKNVLIIVVAIVLSVFTVACGGNGGSQSADQNSDHTDAESNLKVALLISGNLGDKSFFDSANNGIALLEEEYGAGIVTKVIETSYDKTKWEPALRDLSEQEWDIIIAGSFDMQEIIAKVSMDYPDKKYIAFDTTMDYSGGEYKNVYSMTYKQNEGSFLVGVLAAKITQSDLEKADKDQKYIGFVGGMDIPVINDFMVGYISGAKYIDEDVNVITSYVGDFSDSAKGMEKAIAQYNQGADIVFAAAGQAGLGVADAALKSDRYAIGVDSDQSLIFEKTDPQKSELIVTSVMKNIDASIVRAIKLEQEGNLMWGTEEALGLEEDGVGVAKNKYYDALVPQDMKQLVDDISEKIKNGEIEVPTAFGMETSDLDALRNS